MTERSGEAAAFDPRFNPAFQPGYRPPATPATTAAVSPDARSPAVGEVGAGPGVVRAGIVRAGVVRAGIVRTGAGDGADGAATPDAAEHPADAARESAAEPPRRNPFVLALWALSSLITLGGIGMVRWSFTLAEEMQGGNMSQVDYQLSNMMQQSSPIFIALGLGVAAMTVFLHAQAWNRRRG